MKLLEGVFDNLRRARDWFRCRGDYQLVQLEGFGECVVAVVVLVAMVVAIVDSAAIVATTLLAGHGGRLLLMDGWMEVKICQ